VARENHHCEAWHFLGRHEWERWNREECESHEHRLAVLNLLAQLESDPLLVPSTPLGLGFEGRFFHFLESIPVVVTWLLAEEICVVTLLRIEYIPH
jgi:hypothetical protein